MGGSWSGHKACAWLGGISISILSESFHLELLSDGEEGVELVLGDGDLPEVHEAQDGLEVAELHTLQVEEGVLVGVPAKDVPEEGGTGGENDFVCLHLGIITGKSDIKEVFLLAEFSESDADVGLEVVPPQAKLLRSHLGKLDLFFTLVSTTFEDSFTS